MKKIIFYLLLSSCSSVYSINNKDYNVKEVKPNLQHYSITFCVGIGLGENFYKK